MRLGRLMNKLAQGRPLLQVALDFTKLTDAVRVVNVLRDLPVDIYEVGTPLIKSEGVRSIEVIRALVGDEKVVLADMKTADTGALEVDLAYNSGADVVTVLASADDEVISTAVQRASELGIEVVVDTIGVTNLFERLSSLRKIGVNIVNIHTGIDVQKRRMTTAASRLSLIKKVIDSFNDIYIAVSGGIKAINVPEFVRIGVSIIVVGSAITKSEDPRSSAIEVINSMRK